MAAEHAEDASCAGDNQQMRLPLLTLPWQCGSHGQKHNPRARPAVTGVPSAAAG